MLRLSRFLRALPSACAVLAAGAAALTTGQTAFAKASSFGASSSSHIRERTEYRSTDAFVRVGLPPLPANDQKQLKGGFTNLLGSTTPAKNGWKLAALSDPVSIGFSPVAYTVNESAGKLTISVTRTGNTLSPVSVQYQVGTQTGAGFATLNSDYSGGTGVLNFGFGVQTVNFTITILQDDNAPVVEPDELLYINLSNPRTLDGSAQGGAVIDSNRSQATVQINDDDSTLQFSSPTFTTVEGTRVANLTVNRVTGSGQGSEVAALARAATFTYTTQQLNANNAATEQLDYTPTTNGTVRFATGSSTATIRIPIIDDRLDEGNEIFNVTIANAAPITNVALVAPTTTEVTIEDDDDTTVSFDSATYSVNESGPSISVNVVRTGANNDTSRPLTVDYATGATGAGATSATANQDYTATSGTLTFAAGDTSETIVIPITQDTIAENNETFSVGLSNVVVDGGNPPAVTGAITPIQTTTVTIIEDDPSFNFAVTEPSFNEGAGTVSLVVTRTLSINTAASVNFATSDGSTTAGSDYVTTTGTLNFTAGQRQATIPVTLIDDRLDEVNELFFVTLSNATAGFQPGPQRTARVTIVDNDEAPTVAVENVSAREGNLVDGQTRQRFVLRLSSPSTRTVSVRYETANGTATIADNDYTAVDGIVTIAPGGTSANIDVPIVNDTKFEDNEGYVLVLSSALNATLVTTRATGTILNVTSDQDLNGDGTPDGINDDDPPTSSFELVNTAISVDENNDQLATLRVRRTGNTTTKATVTLTTADGTALSGADYTATTTILTFPANSSNTTQIQDTTIPILNDNVSEPTESFTATLGSTTATRSTATVNSAAATATISISDTDTFPTVTVDNPRVTEGDSGTTQLIFTATLSTISDRTITLNYSTAPDGSAGAGTATTADNDYVATSGTVTFPPRSTSQTIIVTVNGDTQVESNETVVLNLDSPQNVILGTTQATGTIVSDDTPVIVGDLSFAADSQNPTVNEGVSSGQIVLTVTRSQGEDRAATVDYTTSDGTATAGTDYTETSGTLTFRVGETSATITVPIINDTLKESNETFDVTLSNPSSNLNAAAVPSTTVTIQDDEGTPTLSIANTQVVEGDSGTTSLLFTVSLEPQSQNDVTVQVATVSGGTASPNTTDTTPQDYQPTLESLSFAPGESTQTFAVTVISDTLVESDETVAVELSNALGAPLGRSKATGTILNDDQPGGGGTISFLTSTYSVNESAGTATITLGRSGKVDMIDKQSASVRVTTGQGTATAGEDYRAVNTVVTFAAGQTSRSITIPIINNSVNEPNETVPLTLSSPSSNAILGTITRSTLTIVDDDAISTVPRADSLTPSNVSVREFNITSTYSSDRGANGLSSVLIQFSGDTQGNGLRVVYTPSNNTLSLNGQTATPGARRTLTDRFGSLDCSKTTVTRSGNTLRITWAFKLAFTYSKPQPIFVGATSPEGQSVFVRRGTWTAPAANTSPSTKNS